MGGFFDNIKSKLKTAAGLYVNAIDGGVRPSVPGAGTKLDSKIAGRAEASAKLRDFATKVTDKSSYTPAESVESKFVVPPRDGTGGNGADLYKFSSVLDMWVKVKANDGSTLTVGGTEYTWYGSYNYGYYGPTPPPPPPPPPPLPDVDISYEMLDSNAHQFVNYTKYQGRGKVAHLIYLIAREVFGDENNVINGEGATAESVVWKRETDKFVMDVDVKTRINDIIQKTKLHLQNGGSGYIDKAYESDKGLPNSSIRISLSSGAGLNSREVIETANVIEVEGPVFLSYDDLVQTIVDMGTRKELIHLRDSTVRNILRKAFEDKPGVHHRWMGQNPNKLLKSRTSSDWKTHIDSRIVGAGINKQTNQMQRQSSGAVNQHNLDWIDLMRVIGVTARTVRRTGSGTPVTNKTKDVSPLAKSGRSPFFPKTGFRL